MHKLKAKQEGQTRTKHQTQNQEKYCKINSIQGTWTCVFQSGRASTVGSAERTSHSKPRVLAFALSQMKSWTQMKPWTQMKSWTQMNSILKTSKRKLKSLGILQPGQPVIGDLWKCWPGAASGLKLSNWLVLKWGCSQSSKLTKENSQSNKLNEGPSHTLKTGKLQMPNKVLEKSALARSLACKCSPGPSSLAPALKWAAPLQHWPGYGWKKL